MVDFDIRTCPRPRIRLVRHLRGDIHLLMAVLDRLRIIGDKGEACHYGR